MREKRLVNKKKSIIWMMIITLLFTVQSMPQRVKAAEQTVGNMVIMVTFEKDDDGNNLTDEFADGYPQTGKYYYCWNQKSGKGSEAGVSYFKDIYTKETGSLPHYINTISDGKVQVNCYFPQEDSEGKVTTIRLSGKASDYLNPDSVEDSRFVGAVIEALKKTTFSQNLSAAELDSWNQDGCIDNLTILVQGKNTGSFGSHKSEYGGTEEVCFRLRVGAYNVISTEALRSQATSTAYSLVSHEFLHTLGAPDLYRTTGDDGIPVGIWDQMAQVPRIAQYPLAYIRSQMGWMDIQEVTESGDYTLEPASAKAGNRAYILKTSMSESEYFVVEYRQKKQQEKEYDNFLPVEKGLIVYRVNEAVENHTNKAGKNYIYVYRPGTSEDHEAAKEQVSNGSSGLRNAVYDAAIGVGNRTSLGSSDMSAPCTQDTIFYSDGSNSGIVIDNIRFQENGTATFHVEFPALSEENYWIKQDTTLADMQSVSMTEDADSGMMYLAGVQGQIGNSFVKVYANLLDGTGWKQTGQELEATAGTSPKVYFYEGVLYLAYQNRQYQTCVSSLQTNGWSTPIVCNDINVNNYQFVENQGKLWLAYSSANILKIWDFQSGRQKAMLQVSSLSIGNPSVFNYEGELYAVYADYFAKNSTAKKGKIAKYSEDQQKWQDIYTINGISTVKVSDVKVQANKINIVASNDASEEPLLISGTPESGFTEEKLSGISASNRVQLQWKDGVAYVIWCDNATLRARYQKNGIWTDMSTQICSDAYVFDTVVIKNVLYVGNSSLTSGVTLRKMKTVEGTPEIPSPPVTVPGSNEVVLQLPAGYDAGAKIYIDGVAYTSASWNQNTSARLVSIGKQGAKTAVIYQYNASGIPVGMYVWLLEYNGTYYTAQAVPELQDLFSYHGFSVRYTGNTGLRCSFGIDTTKKSQLISTGGMGGYRLTEMGTLIMNPDNRNNYPMVYGGDKVAGGRTFYIENGKTYNKVIRTVNGREQFANVLVGLPPSRYATNYVFRAYAVMEHNGTQVVLYGPEMSRSMYTVCKQILDRGDFKQGSAGYTFLKNITDSVETTR